MLDRVLGVKDESADKDSAARKALLHKLGVVEAEKEEPTFFWSKTLDLTKTVKPCDLM